MHSRHSRRPAACAPLAVLLLWADGVSGYMSGTLARRAHAGDALRAPPVSAALSPPSAASGADGSSRMQQQQTQGKSMVTGALEAMLPGYSAAGAVSEAGTSHSRGAAGRGGSSSNAVLPGSIAALLATGDAEQLQRRKKLLDESYEACRVITAHYAKTFYFGTKFFSEEKRRAVFAIYAWCRRTDDIVDKPRKETVSLRRELSEWGRRLRDVWNGRAHDLLDLALVDTVQKYPELTIEPFEDMIKGMVMDLDQNRFANFDELYLYCYRVAGTVGLMMMPVMGTAPGVSFEKALEPALALGVGLQLTNILRDVGEDRVRQRIYLPQEDLRRFGVSEASLLKGVKDEKYVALIKFQIQRARDWYKKAEDGIPLLAPDCQLPIRASLDMYSSILDKIEENNYDNFNKRAYTTKLEKLMMLPRAYLRVKNPDLGL